ncbi:hypothetical protein O3M35_006789 [Rhynocoris fuscipes]|uniref:RING-type domain-containing protein n=1 Tax=Rhynocoris fuscipes TaxID=488301 RepID=A0AAW1DER5_9HEMI
MRSAWVAIALLLTYLILVFLAFRFFDIILWYQNGVSSTEIVNPLFLSVRQLKQFLEVRGVSYTGYVEKQELIHLVEASADVLRDEVEELGERNVKEKERLSSTPVASHFTGAAHFYEQVEDTKDSVWLLQVVPSSMSEPLLDDYTWTVVRNMVAPFAIRTGIFNCRLDHRLCSTKGWTQPLLLLAMPRGTKPKDKVIMRVCHLTKPNAILEWLSEQLSVRVKKISNYEDLEREWLQSANNKTSTRLEASNNNLGVKVLLLTHLLHPPLFLAALSIKFTGRITFGIFTVKKEDANKIGKVPKYLIITPDKTIVYGRRKLEHFNFKSMNAFLRAIQPELNDFFVCSLVLINMLAVFYFLQVCRSDCWWRLVATSLCTVILFNLLLFTLWLVLIAALRWPLTASIYNYCIYTVRVISLSETGSLIRSDWIRLLKSYWIFICSVFAFGIFARHNVPANRNESGSSWWEIDCLFSSRPQAQLLSTIAGLDAETGVLIERLANPALWLEPSLSHQYATLLPVHRYRPAQRKLIKKDSPEALQTVMDTDDDNVVSLLSRKDLMFDSKDVSECAICLERYKCGVLLCTLPCSHNYHQTCILTWLYRDNHHCPICRWPAYKNKI